MKDKDRVMLTNLIFATILVATIWTMASHAGTDTVLGRSDPGKDSPSIHNITECKNPTLYPEYPSSDIQGGTSASIGCDCLVTDGNGGCVA